MKKDVELVIRAKNEASRAIDSVAAALEALASVQKSVAEGSSVTGSSLSRMGAAVADLSSRLRTQTGQSATEVSKAYQRISAEADKVSSTLARQRGELSRSEAEYAALKAEMSAAEVAIVSIRAKMSSGSAEAGLAARLAAAQRAYRDLGAQAVRTGAANATQAGEILKNEEALRKIESAAIAARLALADLSRTGPAGPVSTPQSGLNTGPASQATAAYRAQVAAVNDARVAWKAAEVEASRLGKEVAQAVEPTVGLEAAFTAARLAAAEAQQAYESQAGALNRLKGVAAGSYADFDRAAEALTIEGKAAHVAAAGTNDLSAVLPPIRPRLQAVSDGLNQTALAANNAGNAAERAGQKFNKVNPRKPFLGLSPYEFQNLTFQINDIITQLGSGASLQQTLAQQGGQIFQIFQGRLLGVGKAAAVAGAGGEAAAAGIGAAGAAASAAAPPVAVVAGVLVLVVGSIVTLASALKNLGDRAKSMKEFNNELISTADSSAYNAAALADVAHNLDVYGGSLDDARASLKAFIKEGIDPTRLEAFGRTAQNMSTVMGVKVPEAAQQLAEAFSGGYAEVKKLDDATNFLTLAEREHIKAMFDAGHAQEARAAAYEIFARKQDEAASKTRGPWTQAVRNLAGAWDNVLRAVENSAPVQTAIKLVGWLADEVERLTSKLPGAQQGAAAGQNPELARLQSHREDLLDEQAVAKAREQGGLPSRGSITQRARPLAEVNAELADVDAKIADIQKRTQQVTNDATAKQQKADKDAVDAELAKLDAAKGLTAEKRIQQAQDEARENALRGGASQDAANRAAELAGQREKLQIIKEQRAELERSLKPGVTLKQLDFMIKEEGFRDHTYQDTGGTATIGYGHTGSTGGPQPTPGARIKRTDALQVLNQDLSLIGARVDTLVKVPITPEMRAALVSYEFNTGALAGSAILKQLNAGNYAGAQTELRNGIQTVKGKPSKVLRERRGREADLFGSGGLTSPDIIKQQADDAEKAAQAQADFNADFDEYVAKQKDDLAIAKARQAGDEALVRTLTIEAQVREKVAEAARKGLKYTPDQINQIRELTAATYDAANADRLRQEAQDRATKPVEQLQETRRLLMEQIEFEKGQGNDAAVEALNKQLEDTNKQLLDAIDKLIAFWQAFDTPEARNAVLQLQNLKTQITVSGKTAIVTAKQINDMLAGGLTDMFDKFAQSLGQGKNAITSLRDAFLNFAADFLRQIALMIIKQAILNALQKAGKSGGGGIGGIFVRAIEAVVGSKNHAGGMAGRGAPVLVSPAWFSNAQRLHSGGIPGLKPNEVPTILENTEEVLTRSDPRHVLNGGKTAAGAPQAERTKILNLFDVGSFLTEALNTPDGERAIWNFVSRNPGKFRQVLQK